MGRSLALLHQREPDKALGSRTLDEVENVRRSVTEGRAYPAPYERVGGQAIIEWLDTTPPANDPVWTHGSPVVASALVVDSAVSYEPGGEDGFDPPERDLAIVLRSIAETFTSEVARTFLDGYQEAGGCEPESAALDWYGLLAAFR